MNLQAALANLAEQIGALELRMRRVEDRLSELEKAKPAKEPRK